MSETLFFHCQSLILTHIIPTMGQKVSQDTNAASTDVERNLTPADLYLDGVKSVVVSQRLYRYHIAINTFRILNDAKSNTFSVAPDAFTIRMKEYCRTHRIVFLDTEFSEKQLQHVLLKARYRPRFYGCYPSEITSEKYPRCILFPSSHCVEDIHKILIQHINVSEYMNFCASNNHIKMIPYSLTKILSPHMNKFRRLAEQVSTKHVFENLLKKFNMKSFDLSQGMWLIRDMDMRHQYDESYYACAGIQYLGQHQFNENGWYPSLRYLYIAAYITREFSICLGKHYLKNALVGYPIYTAQLNQLSEREVHLDNIVYRCLFIDVCSCPIRPNTSTFLDMIFWKYPQMDVLILHSRETMSIYERCDLFDTKYCFQAKFRSKLTNQHGFYVAWVNNTSNDFVAVYSVYHDMGRHIVCCQPFAEQDELRRKELQPLVLEEQKRLGKIEQFKLEDPNFRALVERLREHVERNTIIDFNTWYRMEHHVRTILERGST